MPPLLGLTPGVLLVPSEGAGPGWALGLPAPCRGIYERVCPGSCQARLLARLLPAAHRWDGVSEPQAGGSTPTVPGRVGSILWFGRHLSVCLPCSRPSCRRITSYTSPSVESGTAVISSSHWALSVEVDFNAH